MSPDRLRDRWNCSKQIKCEYGEEGNESGEGRLEGGRVERMDGSLDTVVQTTGRGNTVGR